MTTHIINDAPKFDGGHTWHLVRVGDFCFWCVQQGHHHCPLCRREFRPCPDYRGQNCPACAMTDGRNSAYACPACTIRERYA